MSNFQSSEWHDSHIWELEHHGIGPHMFNLSEGYGTSCVAFESCGAGTLLFHFRICNVVGLLASVAALQLGFQFCNWLSFLFFVQFLSNKKTFYYFPNYKSRVFITFLI